MLHTSNTASIKLNSNVVAEFPRSKKLIKYPRVALTSAAQSSAGGYEGYIVNQSSVYGGPPNAWQSFGGNQHWLSSNNSFDGGDDVFNTVNGPWISIQLPTKIKLEYLEFYVGSGRPGQTVAGGSVYASNDGSNWISIGSLDNLGNYTDTSPAHVNFTHTTRYDRYLLHVTSVSLYTYAHIERLSLFGVPEYDPEAHGTDVVVKSVANVPNTDWLDIYIDGQDYPTMPSGPGSVLDKSTNNRHGTPSNVTFNSTWKAFEIESASTSNITIPFNSTGGEYVHTIALWFWMDTTASDPTRGDSDRCIFTIRGSESTGRQIALIVNQDDTNVGFKYDFYSADVRYHDPSVVANKWMHVALTYSGGNNSIESKEIYLNGVRLGVTAENSDPLNLTGTENLLIGGDLNSGNVSFEGMVANFRMFNRVLTTDEIYQLYAYQKEYFGHGDLSMTLKAGRLGIGTSEPRAALDVRGDVHFHSLLASASGGAESQITDQGIAYKVHSFTSTGTSQITVDKAGFFECLVVAGGGAGGGSNGAGGGGGGVVIQRVFVHTGTYDVVVGAGNTSGTRDPGHGGTDVYNPYPTGKRGGNSSVFGLLAIGGGNGGGDDYSGVDGGSGGGCGDDNDILPGRGVQNQEGSNGYGNRGGYTRINNKGGSGGGGAGEVGFDVNPEYEYGETNTSWFLLGRDGGNGVGSTIRTGSMQHYGGGGGGAQRVTADAGVPGAGVGGKGGGGNGGIANGTGSAGSTNTGGGGGGSSSSSNGGNGGSGIVVVRYRI